MPNRQHGRTTRPADRRSQAGSRTARTVPASRVPGTPSYLEPEVRRWPHPLEDPAPSPAPEPALHYIRCALSYQNQLLADIKTLLEQLAADRTAVEAANPEDNLSKM